MGTTNQKIGLSLAACWALTLQGCGGGSSVSGSRLVPTAVTKSRTASLFLALGQGSLSMVFAAYGPTVSSRHRQAFSVPMLGVYDSGVISPEGVKQVYSLDAGGTQPAGELFYATEDVGVSQNGTMAITAGRYVGLTGNYLQSLVSGGFSGNESYSIPGVATTSGEFSLTLNSVGKTLGNEQFAVALSNGYTQNEQIALSADFSQVFVTTDANNYSCVFDFAADGSGSGTVKGSDPGLPATARWDVTGTGQVTFADGSTSVLTYWHL